MSSPPDHNFDTQHNLQNKMIKNSDNAFSESLNGGMNYQSIIEEQAPDSPDARPMAIERTTEQDQPIPIQRSFR